jgi:predicted nucleic acid-binding protein
MIAYLDTNAAMRLAHGRSRLISREAAKLLERAELLLSPMVLLELELL